MGEYSKESLEKIISKNSTLTGILKDLGYVTINGALITMFKKYCSELGISLDLVPSLPKATAAKTREEVFCKNSTVTQNTVRRFFKKEKVAYKCSICGLEPYWNGKELSLTLDHINGDNKDNRLTNLRWVCPNCDRQLPTFGSKNKKNQKDKIHLFCKCCGKENNRTKSGFCKKCYISELKKEGTEIYEKYNPKSNAKINAHYVDGVLIEIVDTIGNPYSKESLEELIRASKSMESVAKKFGVSVTALKKYLKRFNMPYRFGDYKTKITPTLVDKDKIISILTETKSLRKTADSLGINSSSLQEFCTKNIKGYKKLIDKNISKKELIDALKLENGCISAVTKRTGRCREHIRRMIKEYKIDIEKYKNKG